MVPGVHGFPKITGKIAITFCKILPACRSWLQQLRPFKGKPKPGNESTTKPLFLAPIETREVEHHNLFPGESREKFFEVPAVVFKAGHVRGVAQTHPTCLGLHISLIITFNKVACFRAFLARLWQGVGHQAQFP